MADLTSKEQPPISTSARERQVRTRRQVVTRVPFIIYNIESSCMNSEPLFKISHKTVKQSHVPPVLVQNYSRQRPGNIRKDKESLYEENLQLKYRLAQVEEEKRQMDQRVDILGRENEKRQQLLDNYRLVQEGDHTPNSRDIVTHYHLEKQIKSLQGQLKQQETELQQVKRSAKVLSASEL